MSMLDTILGQVAGHDLSGLAGRVGLTPEQLHVAIVGAGARVAMKRLRSISLQQLLGKIGGEGALAQLGGVLGGGGPGGLGGMFGNR